MSILARVRRSSRTIAVFGFAFLGGMTACQIILGLEEPAGTNRPVSPEAEAPVDNCAHVGPPAPPTNPPPAKPGQGDFRFWLAMRRSSVVGRFGPNASAPTPGRFGYDLDGVCSCFAGGGSTAKDGGRACMSKCNPPPQGFTSTCKPERVGCDADGGIDNASYDRLAEFGVSFDIDSALNLTGPVGKGESDLLFHIASYNGEANDDEVFVRVFVAEGIRQGVRDYFDGIHDDERDYTDGTPPRGACDGGTMSTFDQAAFEDSGAVPPEWTGCDRWNLSPKSSLTTDQVIAPTTRGAKGYVTNGVLTVKYEQTIPLLFGFTARSELVGTIMTARIVPMDANFRDLPFPVSIKPNEVAPIFRLDDGVLTGRVKAEDLLRALGSFKSNLSGGDTACKFNNGALVLGFRGLICDDTDSLSDLQGEFVEPLKRCDSTSFALGFTALPSGRPIAADPFGYPPNPCADVDASMFQCPQ